MSRAFMHPAQGLPRRVGGSDRAGCRCGAQTQALPVSLRLSVSG